MSNIKDRLTTYLKHARVTKVEFGRRIGVSNSYVTSMRKSMQPDKAEKIAAEFPDLNIEWLMTGEGEMLKPKSAADGEPPITTGEGSVLINSGGSRVDTNSGAVIYKALDEIAEQRKLTAKAHEQIDRLLAIIDRLTSGVNNNNQ